MNKFNFEPGDIVKLSNGMTHVFIGDLDKLMGENFVNNPLVTVNGAGTTMRWHRDGTQLISDLRLLPRENWEYGTIVVRSGEEPSTDWWVGEKEAIRFAGNYVEGIAFRVDLGRGLIEKLEAEDE